jgi:hypothetical protein
MLESNKTGECEWSWLRKRKRRSRRNLAPLSIKVKSIMPRASNSKLAE